MESCGDTWNFSSTKIFIRQHQVQNVRFANDSNFRHPDVPVKIFLLNLFSQCLFYRAHEQGGMLEHNLAERPTVLSCYYTTIYYSCSAPAQNGYKSLLGKSYYHKYFTYKAVYINYNHIPFPVLSLSLALA